jgi:hypothetical protein
MLYNEPCGVTFCRRHGLRLPWRHACPMRRPSVSRMREIRTSGLKGGFRKRSACATAPEVYQ